ncbi:MAG: chemotaxis protein CheW [Bryobacterales bacterium]
MSEQAELEVQTAPAAPEADDEPPVNHIVFGLHGARYAVSIRSVLELDRLSPITPVPNTPEFVLGVTNVRGEVVSVIDLRRLLGFPRWRARRPAASSRCGKWAAQSAADFWWIRFWACAL